MAHTAAQSYDTLIPQNISNDRNIRRILVIDDDPADRTLYRVFLNTDSENSYHFEETDSGEEAVRLCNQEKYDCVLLDYYLSDQNGLQILDKLIKVYGRSVPIIMLTGQGSETIAMESLRAGAMDYLPKRQASASSLTRTVNNQIEKTQLRNSVNYHLEELEIRNKELTRKHEEIQRFYQTVSHELKTPLTSMKEFVSIILEDLAGPISDEQREYLELVYRGCIQMTNNVNDLLDVTRIETGKYSLEVSPTNLPVVVNHVVKQMQVTAKKKSINLSLSVAENIPVIPLDEGRIEQVISNLIGNAIKFTNQGGAVSVKLELDSTIEDRVSIFVIDNGKGIEGDLLDNVFERLFQVNPETNLDSTETSKAGLGLGLTISRELVSLHGGQLSVQSELGKGSTFCVSLPVYWQGAKST